MRKTSTLFLFAFMLSGIGTTTVSGQNFQWAKRAGGYAYDYGRGVCTDNAGNVYVTGEFELNANFSGTWMSSTGSHEIFIAKYNSGGGLIWVKKAGGVSGDVGHAISCDGNGNIYVTGEFQATSKFGSIYLTATSAPNDIFIAKYNSSGTALWAKKAGGYGNDKGFGVADASGNVYVTGFFEGTISFGSTKLYSAGGKDIFIAKYDTYGNLQWAKRAGGGGSDEGMGITTDNSGNAYITGFFQGGAGFNSTWISGSGGKDAFVAKYSSSGALQWVKKAGGGSDDYGRGITFSNSGNIYLTGEFRGTANFSSVSLSSKGSSDVFIACYNSGGEIIWAKAAGGSSNDVGRGISTDDNSNVYLTGHFGGTTNFGSSTLTAADNSDIFVASYSASGSPRWAMKAGGSADAGDSGGQNEDESGNAIHADNSGNVYVTGHYKTSAVFGGTFLGKFSHTEIFVSKITPSNTFAKKTSDCLTATIEPSDSVVLCSGDNLVLNTNTTDATDNDLVYQWKKDGVNIIGANESYYNARTTGVYEVKIIQGSCIAWSDPVKILIDNCQKSHSNGQEKEPDIIQDISEDLSNEDSFQVKVYPNPTNGLFTIELSIANRGEDKVRIEVLNTVGQVVYTKEPSEINKYISETIELDNTLPTGIYILRTSIGNKIETTEIVLAR